MTLPSASRLQPGDGNLPHQIARLLRNDIEAGVLRHGQALPSTRAMAQEWGVSVFTISEAMKPLIEEGLVIPKSRSMRLVNSPGAHRSAELLVPQMVVIGGYAGSGKTEFARILAKAAGWPILDKDTMTRPVVETALEVHELPPYDRESAIYMGTIRPREYEALMATAFENLACGVSVILAAPFLTEYRNAAWIERTLARSIQFGARTTFVWMHCDAETMHTYLRRRGAARDSGKLNTWSEYLARVDIAFRPAFPHVIVNNSADSQPLQSQAATLLTQLQEAGR
jgi:predicted kinase